MAIQKELFTDGQENERSHNPKQSKIYHDACGPPGHNESQNAKAEVLEYLLRSGTCSCKEIEDTFHRGQAPIRELRVDGHVIDTRRLNGVSVYVYRGFDSRVRVNTHLKDAYYASEHWRRTSNERKSVDNFVCTQCGERDELETHHWRYDLFNEDILLDLQTLCRECHHRLHERLKGSMIHFPRSVSPAVATALR
tara:strand:- start:12248 stop:12832 length:585 start_codon:yes stop_codon:yes gene_type:complete